MRMRDGGCAHGWGREQGQGCKGGRDGDAGRDEGLEAGMGTGMGSGTGMDTGMGMGKTGMQKGLCGAAH